MNKLLLQQKLEEVSASVLHSRVHALNSFNFLQASCMVKRDDELGFGVSGSKIRKYSSLIRFLMANGCKEAIVIGSAHSNNVLSLSQLLIEKRIKPILFLLGRPNIERQGNFLLTSTLVPESQIHWIERSCWPDVEAFARSYANGRSAVVIPEGACVEEALPGAMTLALDILKNEEDVSRPFQHIFIDAGTGLSAIATLLAFAWLDKPALIHILLLAGDEVQFLEKLKRFHQSFELFVGSKLAWERVEQRFKLYRPSLAPSFGSVNGAIMKHIKLIAREEGFLTDPIYSAKLFWESRNIIDSHKLTGNILIIHSGGALTLMGFQKQLTSAL